MNTTSTPTSGVVIHLETRVGAFGYLHHSGLPVNLADAWIMDDNRALEEAQRAARNTSVKPSSIRLIPYDNGTIDEANSLTLAEAINARMSDDEYADLARELLMLDKDDLTGLLKVLDTHAIKALRSAGIRMKGVIAASPPRHATNSLT